MLSIGVQQETRHIVQGKDILESIYSLEVNQEVPSLVECVGKSTRGANTKPPCTCGEFKVLFNVEGGFQCVGRMGLRSSSTTLRANESSLTANQGRLPAIRIHIFYCAYIICD